MAERGKFRRVQRPHWSVFVITFFVIMSIFSG